MSKSKPIPVIQIVLQGYDNQSFLADLVVQLDNLRLLHKQFIYHGFLPKFLDAMKLIGKEDADLAETYGVTSQQLIEISEDEESHPNPLTYGESEEDIHTPVTVVIYHKTTLIKQSVPYQYSFKSGALPGQLVKAILQITYEPI